MDNLSENSFDETLSQIEVSKIPGGSLPYRGGRYAPSDRGV